MTTLLRHILCQTLAFLIAFHPVLTTAISLLT